MNVEIQLHHHDGRMKSTQRIPYQLHADAYRHYKKLCYMKTVENLNGTRHRADML